MSSRAAIRFDNRPEECHKPSGDACYIHRHFWRLRLLSPPTPLGSFGKRMDRCLFKLLFKLCRNNTVCESILPSCCPRLLVHLKTEKLNKWFVMEVVLGRMKRREERMRTDTF